jgi:hypothetical protein
VAIFPAYAANTSSMLSACKSRAANAYKTAPGNIVVKYEGQRTDGTHAVNGTYETAKLVNTFQCSFNRNGNQIVNFVKNPPYSKVDEGAL